MTDLLRLLHRLRDMYLCRYDLQRADIENERRKNTFNKSKAQSTPFSSGRGHLMDALSKPTNAQNRRLKKISDSFDIGDFDQMDEDEDDDVIYPELRQNKARKEMHRVRMRESPQSSRSPSVSSLSPNVSPFPKAVLKNRAVDKRMS